MDRQFLRYLQISFQILDLLMLNLVVVISKYLFIGNYSSSASAYFHFLIYLDISWIVLSWLNRVYGEGNISSFESFAKKTKGLYIIWVCFIMVYLFFFRQFELSRYFILSSTIGFSLGLLLNRFIYIILRDISKSRKYLRKRILIVGYNDIAKRLMQKLEGRMNNKIIGFIEDHDNVNELTPYPIIGGLKQAIALSEKFNVNHIFSTISPEQNNHIYTLMREAEEKFIRFRIIPDFAFFIKMPVHIEFFEGMPMVTLRKEPLEDSGNKLKKRIIDIGISFFVVILVLSWLIPILGLLIYIESPGSIFFSQWRSGRNNKPFKCLKFRSMKINKDADKIQAAKDDMRFTKVGKFIRKTNLDEFPQFINVLKGEMSLVGPRPHMLKHTEEFSLIVNEYMIRQFLKPGITGWAQINGFRGEIRGNEQIIGRVECDLWYSENWTPWLDFRILFLTLYNIFRKDENAY